MRAWASGTALGRRRHPLPFVGDGQGQVLCEGSMEQVQTDPLHVFPLPWDRMSLASKAHPVVQVVLDTAPA